MDSNKIYQPTYFSIYVNSYCAIQLFSRIYPEHQMNTPQAQVISTYSWLVDETVPNDQISVVREPVSEECVVEGVPGVEGLALTKRSSLDDLICSLMCRVSRHVNVASVSRHKRYTMPCISIHSPRTVLYFVVFQPGIEIEFYSI